MDLWFCFICVAMGLSNTVVGNLFSIYRNENTYQFFSTQVKHVLLKFMLL